MLVHKADLEIPIIINMMAELSVGEILRYEAIDQALGRNCRLKDRQKLLAAKKRAARDHYVILETVTKVGYRRLPSDELSSVTRAAHRAIRNKASNGVRLATLGLESANDISPDEHKKVLSDISNLGLIVQLSKERNRPTVTDDKPIPYALVAEQFLARMRGG